VLGLVTTQEIRDLERSRWPETPEAVIMRPLETLRTVHPTTPLSDALKTMVRDDRY
jgi:hypothetical protein